MGYYFADAGPIVSTGFIDTVNDVEPGRAVASFTGQNNYRGQLGMAKHWNNAQAAALSSLTTALGKQYGGIYLYVQTKAASATAPARGVPCYWDTFALGGQVNYVVTPDATASNITQVAGFYLSAPTKGNFCFIIALGIGPVLYKGGPTDTTIGDIVFINSTNANCDANLNGSATAAQQALKVGIAETIPVTAAVGMVNIQQGGVVVPNF